MSTPRDGGRAFPALHSIDGNWVRNPREEFMGMSVRQFYKAAALQGMLASGSYIPGGTEESIASEAARLAGRFADAMVAEDDAPRTSDTTKP